MFVVETSPRRRRQNLLLSPRGPLVALLALYPPLTLWSGGGGDSGDGGVAHLVGVVVAGHVVGDLGAAAVLIFIARAFVRVAGVAEGVKFPAHGGLRQWRRHAGSEGDDVTAVGVLHELTEVDAQDAVVVGRGGKAGRWEEV